MTCVSLRRNPEGSLGVGFRDTWHTPKESEGVSRCGLSGHVAHSEGLRRGFSVWAFGTRGTLRRNPKGALGVGFRDTWHTPKESKGVSPGLGTQDTWRSRKASEGFLLVWALETHGALGRL